MFKRLSVLPFNFMYFIILSFICSLSISRYFILDYSAVLWISCAIILISVLFIMPLKAILFLFIISVFLDKFKWEIFMLTVRPSQLIGLVLFLKWLIVRKSIVARIINNPLSVPLGIFICINLLSAIFSSSNPFESLQECLMLIIIFIPIFVVVDLLHKHETYEQVLNFYIFVGLISAAVGLLGYVAQVIFGYETIIVNPDFGARIVGTVHSAGDHFGIEMMVLFIIMIGYLLSRSKIINMKIKYFYILLFFLALLLSYKRSAWLGAAIGVATIWFILFIQRKGNVFVRKFFTCIMIAVIIIVFLSWVFPNKISEIGGLKENLIFRLLHLLDKENEFRIFSNSYALQRWLENGHLFLGNGPRSMVENIWISNIFIHSLHNTGISGLLSMILIWMLILWEGIKVINSPVDDFLKINLISMFSVFISLLFINMFDNEFPLSIFWFNISLILTTFKLAKQHKNREYIIQDKHETI